MACGVGHAAYILGAGEGSGPVLTSSKSATGHRRGQDVAVNAS